MIRQNGKLLSKKNMNDVLQVYFSLYVAYHLFILDKIFFENVF